MKKIGTLNGGRYSLIRLAVCGFFALGLIAAAHATTIKIYSTSVALPTGWNACSFYASGKPALYKNLKDSAGAATGVSLFLMSPARSYEGSGIAEYSGDAADFELARAKNSSVVYCVDPALDDSAQSSCIRARMMGLDPAKRYEFRFLGSYKSTVAADVDLSTRYSVFGATDGWAELNVNQNADQVARVFDIAPLSDGSVEFTVAAAASNQDARRRGFLCALMIVEMEDTDIYVDPCGTPAVDTKTWNHYNKNYDGRVFVCTMTNLKDASGRPTGINVTQSKTGDQSHNSHATYTFTGDAAPFEAARGGNTQNNQIFFGSNASSSGILEVSGLDPSATYSFSFVACRANNDTSKSYAATYTVTGATSGSADLEALNNESEIATVSGIQPTADGKATVTVTKGTGNNTGYFCLCAYRISKDNLKAGANVVGVRATEGGSVSATVGGYASASARLLSADESLVATAVPAAGYQFLCWTSPDSDEVKTANPLTVTGSRSATWTAVFVKGFPYKAKKIYVDAYGTPAADTKTWNVLADTAFEIGGEQGPFVASNGSTAHAVLRTVQPAVKNLYNSNATSAFTGDAADFEAARNGGTSLYFSYSFVEPKPAYFAYDLTGLKPGRPYTLRFIGTQMAASENRVVRYRCEGGNTVQDSLNTSKNTTGVATCANVVPDAGGTIRIVISPDPANNSSHLFGYLTAFSVEGHFGKTDKQGVMLIVR